MVNTFSFEKLVVWQDAIAFSKSIYELSSGFPESEKYGLTNQIRRASTSIALNIAEGKGRHTDKEFSRFLYISKGSLFEVITCLELAQELKFLDPDLNKKLRNKAFALLRRIVSLIKFLELSELKAAPAQAV